MSPTPFRSLPLIVSAIVLLTTDLHRALAQGSGVVLPEQIAMPLNVSQVRAVEPDGSVIVSLQVQFAFDNQASAGTWSGERPLTVGFTTENGSARAGTCGTAGADYVAQSGSVQFTGQLSQSATLQVCGDDLSEGDEQFGLRLTSTEKHANYFISFRPGRVPQLMTITDDEPLPTLGITPEIEVAEPTSGQASAVFTVSLTGPINQRPVTVEFNTSPGTAAAGTACPRSTENVDYLTKAGTLSFSPPSNLLQSPQIPRTQRVTVSVCSDSQRIEGQETFFVNLARPVNAVLAGAGGTPTSPTSTPTLSVTRGMATIR
jgi:hypothetical protein